jgi:hypothetical protein
MPPVISPSRRPCRLLSFALLAIAAGGVHLDALDLPGGVPTSLPQGVPVFEAPDLSFDGKTGSILAPRGFVARQGDWILVGDSARYDQKGDELYAKGRVVLVIPGVRIHAARLGMHPKAASGDIWDAEVFIEYQDKHFTVRAKRGHFDRRTIVLEGIDLDGGNGGILSIQASRMTVYLRDQPAENRDGIARRVEGIALVNARGSMMGVPVMYLPYAYRDFKLRYPWTRYEFGSSHRQGSYARGWIGTEFPEVWGWTLGQDVRGDMYSRNGEAMGTKTYWRNAEVGYGEVQWYRMAHEQVRDPADQDNELGVRGATVVDAEQRLHGAITGLGAGAVSARWVTLPDADVPGVTNLGPGPDERFRADYLRDDLSTRPFAYRGVEATWGNSLGGITLDTQRHPQAGMPTTERWWGMEAVLPDAHLIGPVYVDGSTWVENLHRRTADTQATRSSYDGAIGLMQWLGAWGVDGAVGERGLSYSDGIIAGAEQHDTTRSLPYSTSGVRVRLVDDFGNGYQNAITPRVGLQILGKGQGDDLLPYGFNDSRDTLEEDKRYGVTSVATEVTRAGQALFTGSVTGRWALRDKDRTWTDSTGTDHIGTSRLVDVALVAQGSPTENLTLTGQGVYSELLSTWQSFDASSIYKVSRSLRLRYTGTLLPADSTRGQMWQNRPGISVYANRYRYDYDMMLQPGGALVDQWSTAVTRHMVDGDLYLFGELVRNDDGSLRDARVGIGFGLTTGGNPDDATPTRMSGLRAGGQ